MSRIVATFFYSGHLRPASGTWGSLAALPAAYLLYIVGGYWLVLIATVAAFMAGLWATRVEIAGDSSADPSHVVIDEVVGQWIALLPVLIGAAHAGVPVQALWPGWVAAFFLFRLFDIWKPGPIGWADRQPAPMGVMLDDVLAGIAAAICVMGLAALAHSGFVASVPDQP